MEDLKDKVAELNKLIQAWNFEEALDLFYAEDLTSHENEDAPTVGLDKYRHAVKSFLGSATDATAEPLHTIIGDGTSATLWHYTFTHPATGPMDYHQLSVQRWRDGRIVHERHHYKTPKWA